MANELQQPARVVGKKSYGKCRIGERMFISSIFWIKIKLVRWIIRILIPERVIAICIGDVRHIDGVAGDDVKIIARDRIRVNGKLSKVVVGGCAPQVAIGRKDVRDIVAHCPCGRIFAVEN